MADQKTPEELATDAAAKSAKVKAAPVEDLTTLHFEGKPYSGKLLIGTEEFAVVDGAVSVPARALQGAQQAGFK